jgi:hypothetical protein
MGGPQAVLAALIVHVALVVATLTGGGEVFNDASERRLGRGADFYALYEAGYAVRDGRSVYARPVGHAPYSYGYRYLPFLGYTLGPAVTVLPPEAAYWSWVVVLEAVFLAVAWLTLARAPPSRRPAVAFVWALSTPFCLELFIGQFSFVTGALVAIALLALDEGRAARAGGAWTASLLVKTNSLLVAPVFAARGRWGLLAGAAGAVAALNAPYFVLEPGSFADARENLAVITDPAPTFAGALGLQTVISTVLSGGAREIVSLTAIAVLSAPVVWLVWRRPDPLVGGLALMCLHFVIYPEVWEHHYSLLLPLLALVIAMRADLARPLVALALLIDLPTPYFVLEHMARDSRGYDPRAFDPEPAWPDAGIAIYHAWKIVPVLGVLAVCAAWLARARAGTVPACPPRSPACA